MLSGGPPLHVHEAEDEVVIVSAGALDYQVGGERGVLEAGGLLWFPRQLPHAVADLTGVPCRFISVARPSGIEDLVPADLPVGHRLPGGGRPDAARWCYSCSGWVSGWRPRGGAYD